MKPLYLLTFAAIFASSPYAQSADTAKAAASRVLFVYDKVDESSAFFINAFRDQLKKADVAFTEAAIDSSKVTDLAPYDHLLIYSRVMGFNMISPVRSWMASIKDLASKKVHLFVTANRWFAEDNKKQLVTLSSKRNGVVDAVSMATQKMTSEQKIQAVTAEVAKVK